MARTVRDATLETRAARERLKPCDQRTREPYWRGIEQGAHIGYYKGDRGGSWLARTYLNGRYLKTTLGKADDTLDADGVAVLSFKQAQEKARQWFTQEARKAAGLEPVARGPYTVRDAIDDYLAHYAGEGKALAATKTAIEAHILPALGDVEVARLTTAAIEKWHRALAQEAPRLRSARGKPVRHAERPADADRMRSRRATANRVLTVLKAALNHAWKHGRIGTDEAWRRVRPFRNVDAPVVRYLTEAECQRLLNASPADFRLLVRAALFTGCRYGELAALRASDFNADSGTLTVRTSKSGKARHVVLTDEAQAFIQTCAAGKAGAAILFTRDDGGSWGKSHQHRLMQEACKHAKIAPAISFHVLRHTHGSWLAMRGVPMPVIAEQLGHADTRMTLKHYAHLSPSYIADTIRANFPTLNAVAPRQVVPIRS